MTASFYIRPVGRLGASSSTTAPEGIEVAGCPDLLFAAAEVIERTGHGIERRIIAARDLLDAMRGAPELLDRLQRPRPAIAGLSFDRPRIIGVVNVTPDSFSDGGRHFSHKDALEHGLQLEAEGADILDVGGESTRPGAEPVDIEEECRRVLPVIEALAKKASVPVSVDTRNADVMRRAAQAGARLINDISALSHDPASLAVAAASSLPVVLMHARGTPGTMQRNPVYDDVVLDVYDALDARIRACELAGIPRARLIVDPGIGFGKTLAHNLALLGGLSTFHGLGCTVLLGASRKSFIGKLTGAAAEDRLPGSLAAALAGVAQGVQIIRVHDVAATRQAILVWRGSEVVNASA